MMFFCNFR